MPPWLVTSLTFKQATKSRPKHLSVKQVQNSGISAIGTKRTCRVALHTSAFGVRRDMTFACKCPLLTQSVNFTNRTAIGILRTLTPDLPPLTTSGPMRVNFLAYSPVVFACKTSPSSAICVISIAPSSSETIRYSNQAANAMVTRKHNRGHALDLGVRHRYGYRVA